jgi:hypothetical protein
MAVGSGHGPGPALTMASSVARTVASNRGLIAQLGMSIALSSSLHAIATLPFLALILAISARIPRIVPERHNQKCNLHGPF